MNWKFEIAKLLYPQVFDEKDKWRNEAESAYIELNSARDVLVKQDDMIQDLNQEIIKLKTTSTDLSQFTGSAVWTFLGGKQKDLRRFLNIQSEKDIVLDWITTNLQLNFYLSLGRDELIYQLRYDFARYHNNKDPHVPEDTGRDNWKLPSVFIKDGLKGDCEDNMLFIKYMYDVICEVKDKESWKDYLFCAVGSCLNKYGLGGTDHAYLIYQSEDDKFYQVESAASRNSDYIKFSLQNLFKTEFQDNIRYPFPYKMWNQNVVYQNPLLR